VPLRINHLPKVDALDAGLSAVRVTVRKFSGLYGLARTQGAARACVATHASSARCKQAGYCAATSGNDGAESDHESLQSAFLMEMFLQRRRFHCSP